MATSGRGTGIVGYNVQTAVDAKHHLIVAHEVTNVGHDRDAAGAHGQARQGRPPGSASLIALADRGYFEGYEILECERAGIAALVPKPLTSNSKAAGPLRQARLRLRRRARRVPVPGRADRHPPVHQRRGRQDAAQVLVVGLPELPDQAASARPASTGASRAGSTRTCSRRCRQRLDGAPEAARLRRQTVEHVFGTLKAWMGSTHFLTRTLPRVRTEMSLQVLAYNLKRAIKILGTQAADRSDEGLDNEG